MILKHNLFYITLLYMLEVEMLLYSGAMGQSSLTQNVDDIKLLELCTARNQQRLGSVFGNFTRHHKKGHRRRTTTTTIATTLDNTESTIPTTVLYSTEATYPKLPNPLRLDRVSDSIDNVLQDGTEEHLRRERRHTKYRDNREEVQTVDDNSLTKSLSKIKKMYRDSSGSGSNKLSTKVNRGGIFLTENCTTVIAQIGTTAILHCEVSDITENTVTWIRRKDYSLLSVGLVTYSADNRFFSAHGRHVKDWALHIRFATSLDAGYYECQVPTHPPTSIFFKLVLVAAYAEIMGESEKIIHEGSMLRLVCVVRRSTEPPSYVFWYFENRMINYDLNGVSVHNGRQTSELVIGRAQPRHAGNYTCVPANAKAASVTVHVVQSETPAAMQHGNNSSSSKLKMNKYIIVLLIFSITISIIKENL